jgi:Sel1 repeat
MASPAPTVSYDVWLEVAEHAVSASDWRKASTAVVEAMSVIGANARDPDFARLVRVAEKVAPYGNVVAFELAYLKLAGRGAPQDREGAELLLRRLAHSDDHHDTTGHVLLGYIHSGDYGGNTNLSKALKHFEQAARLGSYIGAYNAGLAYRYGIAIPTDMEKAERLLRQSLDETRGPPSNYHISPDPGVCLELAVLVALKGETWEALKVLNECYIPMAEIDCMRAAILNDHTGAAARTFALDYERPIIRQVQTEAADLASRSKVWPRREDAERRYGYFFFPPPIER